jgi:hypothetical protein
MARPSTQRWGVQTSGMDYTPLLRDQLLLTEIARPYLDDYRTLTRDVERGVLVKLRRGAYVPTEVWAASSGRGQHILRIRAVIAASCRPIVLAGKSAAAVWGMPIAGSWPSEVTVLDSWHGGGRAEPGVRRTAAGFTTARIVQLGGFSVTDLARTTLDVARGASFADAIGSVDWSLWRNNDRALTKEMLLADAMKLSPQLGRARLLRLIDFSTHLSDSFGESQCRAVIRLQGFASPQLQVEFRDDEGKMYPDLYWPEINCAAEFDGKQKYTRNEFTKGDPAEVVWREKKRQDRLLRQVHALTRILTADYAQPERLVRLLNELGVPRGGRS